MISSPGSTSREVLHFQLRAEIGILSFKPQGPHEIRFGFTSFLMNICVLIIK